MDDDLPEKIPDFGSFARHSIPQPLSTAEAFEKECYRRAKAMGVEKAGPGFRIMVAMDCLGPPGLRLSKKAYRRLLEVVAARVPPDRMKEGLWDAVVAFGCGWERAVEDGASAWEGYWPGAVAVLEALVRRSVKSANFKLLRSVGLGGSDAFDLKAGASGEGIPFRLALQLVRPLVDLEKGQSVKIVAKEGAIEVGQDVDVPPGGKHVIHAGESGAVLEFSGEKHMLGPGAYLVIACCDGGAEIRLHPEKKTLRLKPGESAELLPKDDGARLIVRECSCGTVRCAERHRLSSWDPARNSLRAFVAAAVKGLKPKGGKTPPGIVSLQQGMLFQHYNLGVEAGLGDKKHLVNVRLRLVPAASKECTCGSRFLEGSCPACGSKFDPARMKVVKMKAFLILEGVDSDSQTRLEKLGKCFVRRGFLRCNRKDEEGRRVCDNHFDLTDDLLTKQVRCSGCGRPVWPQEEIRKLFTADGSSLQILRRLQAIRQRMVEKEMNCPHCGAPVIETPVQCPLCNSCQMGQNLVFLYERRPPQLIRKLKGAGLRGEGDGDDDPIPGADGPKPEEEV